MRQSLSFSQLIKNNLSNRCGIAKNLRSYKGGYQSLQDLKKNKLMNKYIDKIQNNNNKKELN